MTIASTRETRPNVGIRVASRKDADLLNELVREIATHEISLDDIWTPDQYLPAHPALKWPPPRLRSNSAHPLGQLRTASLTLGAAHASGGREATRFALTTAERNTHVHSHH